MSIPQINQVSPNVYSVPIGDGSDFIETAIIGSASGSFTPSMKFSRWDECSVILQMIGPNALFATSQIVMTNAITGLQTVRAVNPSVQVDHSPVIRNSPFNEFGGLDHTTVLFRSVGNSLTYMITLNNTIALMQLGLTKEWTVGQDMGHGTTAAIITDTDVFDNLGVNRVHRPPWVVGSISFHHATKGGMVSTEDDVKGIRKGKFGHLYARLATDSSTVPQTGYTYWAYSGNAATETLPSFANTPVYPITLSPVGDTFGYTTIGGSSINLGDSSIISAFYPITAANTGTLSSITSYGYYEDGPNIEYGIYVQGLPSIFVANTPAFIPSATPAWNTYSITGAISAGISYALAIQTSATANGYVVYYDSSISFNAEAYQNSGYGNWPGTIATWTYNNPVWLPQAEYSIYATYSKASTDIPAVPLGFYSQHY